jgi:hypothetical protein
MFYPNQYRHTTEIELQFWRCQCVIIPEYDHTNCQDLLLWFLFAQKHPHRNFAWRYWQPPRRTARDITSYRPSSKQQPVVCLRLIHWRGFLPSFLPSVLPSVTSSTLPQGPVNPFLAPLQAQFHLLAISGPLWAHWRPPQLNRISSTQPLRVNCHIKL